MAKGLTPSGKKQVSHFQSTINPSLNDCWIVIYEDADFHGRSLKLNGPAEYKNLKTLPGNANQDWGDSIGSIVTGPRAQVIVFDDEDFSGDHIDTYGPNTRTDVSSALDDNIDSLKISFV